METIINKTGKLVLPHADKKEFILDSDWQITHNEEVWLIDQGFITDLASIPSIFFLLQWGLWNYSAIVHDHIYQYGYLWLVDGEEKIAVTFNRKQTDYLFYSMNRSFGVNKITAYLMYLAVRLFGKKAWNKARTLF